MSPPTAQKPTRRDIEAEGSRRIHGHTDHAEVTLAGDVDRATGMVVDLGLVRMWRDGVGVSCTLR